MQWGLEGHQYINKKGHFFDDGRTWKGIRMAMGFGRAWKGINTYIKGEFLDDGRAFF